MFVAREHELKTLERLYSSDSFEMVVLYGRRRVGKTALIDEFVKDKQALYFTAIQQSAKMNLEDFSRAVMEFFGMPASTPPFGGWREALSFVAEQTEKSDKRIVFVFDEFPYAATAEPALPSILQIAIDHGFLKTNMTMILSGSNEGFMENNVLGRKSPLYGRRTAQIRLLPFDYADAAKFLPNTPAQERILFYAAFGGTPYYLARLRERDGFEANVLRLMFDSLGVLREEPMMLLREELREPASYYSILLAIAGGKATPKLIAEHAGVDADSIGAYLKTLVGLRLIDRKVPFGDDPSKSRKGMYVVSDPFFAYWFRFVGRNMSVLEGNIGEIVARKLAFGPAFDTYVGQQFETVCQQWLIRRNAAGELPFIATQFGKWWGNDPIAREQTDIDVIAADPSAKAILFGECKWRNSFNESEAIARLHRRAGLIKGYHTDDAWMTLFTKNSVAESTRNRHAGDKRMSFVTAEDLYEE
ncbi:ATP-binding protein [Bifidobacterium simiarum]|uniref:ATPase n=1 Tax=Bifidobacterium simiarum TaxID=2045441 RepID=A0A2M9HCH0_9BIFI|nr:ATP-binding protein [Bifidobacterium simiarum]MBT1166597.1 ATP-binding protein [Bifidobacterium simiarum]PJM74491.1 ATPase [Bifidobacterium simiarum]